MGLKAAMPSPHPARMIRENEIYKKAIITDTEKQGNRKRSTW
jgi:hypothetical protein